MSSRAVAQDTFVRTDGPYGGTLYDYAVAGNGTVYAVTANFDVYRSDNGGASYVPLATVADDTTAQWIEMVAADSSGSVYIGGDYGIWRSDNKGESWTKFVSGLPDDSDPAPGHWNIYELEVNARSVVMAVYMIPRVDTVVLRSTDRGATWTRSTVTDIGGKRLVPYALAVSPTGTFFVSTYRGIYRSVDDGTTWSRSTFNLPAGDSTYRIAVGNRGALFLTTEQSLRLFRSTDDGVTFTEFTPTGLPGGPLIRTMATTASGTLLATIGTQGGFRSTDGGNNWMPVTMDSPVNGIAASPSGAVWAAGTDPFISSDDGASFQRQSQGLISTSVQRMIEGPEGVIYAGSPLAPFRSDDTGRSWIPIPVQQDFRSRDLEIAPDGALWVTVERHGIARSIDKGATWAYRNSGLTSLNVADLEFASDGRGYAVSDSGFFLTTDNGATWDASSDGLTTKSLRVLTIAPDGSLLVGTITAGMARSTDRGLTWTPVNSGLRHSAVQAIITTSQGAVFIGMATPGGIYRSLDNGLNWQSVAPYHTTAEVRGLTELRNGTIYAGSYYIARSTDNGFTWSPQIEVPFYNYFLVPWVLEHSSGRLLFGTLGAGVGEMIPDAGDRWSRLDIDAPTATSISGYTGAAYRIAASTGVYIRDRWGPAEDKWHLDTMPIPGNPTVRHLVEFASTAGASGTYKTYALTSAGLFHRTNSAAWEALATDLPANTTATTLAVNNVHRVLMLGTANGLYRSQSNGDTWTAATTGPTTEITTIEISGKDSGYAFAAVRGGGVFRSNDLGWNWTAAGVGLPSNDVLAIAVSPRGILYAGTAGAGVYKSDDNGATWTATGSLNGRTITSLIINSNGILFAGTDRGVYRSTDAAASFARVNTDHNGMVYQVHDDGRGSIMAATDAGVFYSTPAGAVTGVTLPTRAHSESAVMAVAGNPVRDRSTVLLYTRRGGHARIALVDASGVERLVIMDEALTAGEYALPLDVGGLPKGAYFLRLTLEDESIVTGVSVE